VSKFGHVEAHLAAANPRSWSEKVAGEIETEPAVVLIVSGGVTVAICLVVWLWLRISRKP